MASPKTISVATNGDMILEVGTEIKAHILVSADILRERSSYFSARLSDCWREDQVPRSSAAPQSITIKGDDHEAMIQLIMLIHGRQPDDFPDHAINTPSELLKLAVVVDKYDCMKALLLQSQGLLYGLLQEYQPNDFNHETALKDIAAAAYLLEHALCFSIATERLMRETTSDGWQDSTTPASSVPQAIFDAIDHKRLIASEKIAYEVPYLVEDQDAMENAFDRAAWPGWPSPRGTVQHAIDSIPKLYARDDVRDTEAKDLVGQLKGITWGLCLQCAKVGSSPMMECKETSHKEPVSKGFRDV